MERSRNGLQGQPLLGQGSERSSPLSAEEASGMWAHDCTWMAALGVTWR